MKYRLISGRRSGKFCEKCLLILLLEAKDDWELKGLELELEGSTWQMILFFPQFQGEVLELFECYRVDVTVMAGADSGGSSAYGLQRSGKGAEEDTRERSK